VAFDGTLAALTKQWLETGAWDAAPPRQSLPHRGSRPSVPSNTVGEPSLDLAARQLLTQNDGAHLVEADEVKRVLADVDADCRNGFKAGGPAWHGMLLLLAAACQLSGWAGQEHGGSTPLAVIRGHFQRPSLSR
jgi:hypothetical protein